MFPNIYDAWVCVAIKAIKNILELGGHPDHNEHNTNKMEHILLRWNTILA